MDSISKLHSEPFATLRVHGRTNMPKNRYHVLFWYLTSINKIPQAIKYIIIGAYEMVILI